MIEICQYLVPTKAAAKSISTGRLNQLKGKVVKDNLFRASAYAISIWTGVMLSSVSQWVPNSNQWHNEMINIEERIIEFTDQENKAYGSEII